MENLQVRSNNVRIGTLRNSLPTNWVSLAQDKNGNSRSFWYKILNNERFEHPYFKTIVSLAEQHAEAERKRYEEIEKRLQKL